MHVRDSLEATSERKGEKHFSLILWFVWLIWLPFLIPDIVALFQRPSPLPNFTITLLGCLFFIGIYLWATWHNVHDLTSGLFARQPGIRDWLQIAVLLGISITLVLLNGKGWLSLCIFTIAYTASRFPLIQAAIAIAVLLLLAAFIGHIVDPSWSDLEQPLFLIIMVGIAAICLVRLMRTSIELRAARAEIADMAVIAERLRIAHDLHDLLGHTLSLITLKSELARRMIATEPERASIEIADIEQVARQTLQEVREAVTGYRQPALTTELQHAQKIVTTANISYHFEGDAACMENLPPEIEAVLAWTVREGVTNVIRHSRAHTCLLRIERSKETIFLEILDTGNESHMPIVIAKGNGLSGLAERVEILGGTFEAGPHIHDFLLAVSLPLFQDTLLPQVVAKRNGTHRL